MIVRTYGRRTRCISNNNSYSDSSFNGDNTQDPFLESLSQESFRDTLSLSQETPSQETFNFSLSSSQDSSPWTFDSDIYAPSSSQNSLFNLPPRPPLPKLSKKPRNLTKGVKKSSILKGGRSISMSMPATSTLMEAQEFGEMMEHVDEVNFALDGLRKDQPVRIRRASLLSLLTICATATERRLLRAQGMAKTIIDAIVALSLDDIPSTLAAAALIYILASDGQDEHLLDSPICVRFLLKLLRPFTPATSEAKAPSAGCKILALCRDPVLSTDGSKRLDASSIAIFSKVEEILLSCKEIHSITSNTEGIARPELSPKWIALLTMEKACLSTVSLEDTSETVRRIGGEFKERLREYGGLDAVFDVAVNCHSIMGNWSEYSKPSILELKDDVALQTVVTLLKCLKITENATFLSKDNQNHLLGIDKKSDYKGSPQSFTSLVISVIKILSGLSLLQSSSSSSDDKFHSYSDWVDRDSKGLQKENHGAADQDGMYSSNSSGKSFRLSQKRQRSSNSPSVYSVSTSETTSVFIDDVYSTRKDDNPSTSGSYNGTSQTANGGVIRKRSCSKMNLGLGRTRHSSKKFENCNSYNGGVKMDVGPGKRPCVMESSKYITIEDSQDPFAFDENEFEPTKWDKLSKSSGGSQSQKNGVMVRVVEDEYQAELMTSQLESSNGDHNRSCEIPCSPLVSDENFTLLADCLLTAVKVLMNLTNDNPLGCEQIAVNGGLETLSTLIVGHFPSFSSCLSLCSTVKGNGNQSEKRFTDQELDFLVAILGLLVNLVEKDSLNRSRLAAGSVSLPISRQFEDTEGQRDVIPLLCSIFLSNQGAGEAAEEGKLMPWDADAAMVEGEREAEKMIIEAYAALLLAFLSTESKNVREAIANRLPDHNLESLVPVLERFVAFHLTMNMISPETHTTVNEVIESCKGS
ncbi:hypothetical protein GIB67_039126 [Kingdonia uniflora]|uniref:WAPL domain-containing protein n=1 Tax=Kingdonia uniflora TaxID=39325 RepID=A0A7J7MLJ5_9MAGN|nr:hypothetical protein GIB67_039126 [Kingdonia uniflora]